MDRNHNHHASAVATLNEVSDLETALNQGNASTNHAADIPHAEATPQSRVEDGGVHQRDALSHERPSERMINSDNNHTTSADRNSRFRTQTYSAAEFDELRSLPRLDDQRSPPPRYMLHPLYSSGDSRERSHPHSYSQPVGTASFTPGFPPAHRSLIDQPNHRLAARRTDLTILADQVREFRTLPRYREDSELASMLSDLNAMIDRTPSDLSQDYLLTETEYIYSIRERVERMAQSNSSSRVAHSMDDNDVAELPLLRRMSRRGADSSQPLLSHTERDNLDGLGDRQRSFSPDSISWEAMLTTIPPDDRVPSTHSSFTSASASATNSLESNSASASSYGTLITVPSISTEAEPCPAADVSSSDSHSQSEDGPYAATPPRRRTSVEFLTQANDHLDRIESLSRRLQDQRARSEDVAHRRRILQRETELQRIEANLLRLERQIEEERLTTIGTHRLNGVRTGRERL
ncbi:MAG: hypothetical protein Q9164_000205 [Protoblastenia rupestris]